MNRSKSKIWLISVLLFMITAVAAILFWDTLVMLIAPNAVLSAAIADTFAKLEYRFAESPLWTLSTGYDEQWRNTVRMQLDTKNELVGEVCYDMLLQTDAAAHQIKADGVVYAQGRELDISAYLNSDFVALTSKDLLQGGYYGITYDSFSSDIRSFPLISMLIPNARIHEWEASLKNVQAFMNQDYTLPQIPDFTEDDIKMLLLGILALRSDVTREDILLEGQMVSCYKITYSESGDRVGEVLRCILNTESQDYQELTAVFYLYEKTLIKAELCGTAGQNSVRCDISLGLNSVEDDLALALSKANAGENQNVSMIVSTRREENRYIESILIDNAAITYNWNPVSGDMELYLPNREQIVLNLATVESGFRVETKDLMILLGLENKTECDCTMEISKGSSVSEPAYKNLNEWSWSDLLVLLSGVGSFLGLQIG